MISILFILWFSMGVLGTMSLYYTDLKTWYFLFKEDKREWDKNNGGSSLEAIISVSPLLVFGGGITLLVSYMTSIDRGENFTFYFKVPSK